MEMSNNRYRELFYGDSTRLTLEEIFAGWHWCEDWDYLPLQNPDPTKPCKYCGGQINPTLKELHDPRNRS